MKKRVYLVGDTLELALSNEAWYTDEDEAREASSVFSPPFRIFTLEVTFNPGLFEEL